MIVCFFQFMNLDNSHCKLYFNKMHQYHRHRHPQCLFPPAVPRGKQLALFGQWKGEIKENGTVTWELGLKVFRRSPSSLTPGANHNFKASLCPFSQGPLGQISGQHPPGLIRTGRGAPVKHAGCGRGLISFAKRGTRALGPHLDVLNPRLHHRTKKARGALQSQKLMVQS